MKICIARCDRMGDMILTLPVIQGIKEQNPQAIIHVIASQKNSKICMQYNLIDKIFEKSNFSSSFNKLSNTIGEEKYDYFFTFSPGWFGLLLGIFSRSKFKASLILKSRYNSNIFSKLGQIFFTKLFYSLSIVINRFKLLLANKNIHQTIMMMDVVSKSGVAINRKTQNKFIFNNTFTLNKIKPVCIVHLSSKWINSYYSEDDFNNLLKLLNEKKISIYLTTDETTKNKFSKIFETFDMVKDTSNIQNNKKNILICDNFSL